MPGMTTIGILQAARKYAEDPSHIVKNSDNWFEDAEGQEVGRAEATCGCLVGIPSLVADRQSDKIVCLLWDVAAANGYRHVNDVVDAGQAAMLAVYDEAIRRLS